MSVGVRKLTPTYVFRKPPSQLKNPMNKELQQNLIRMAEADQQMLKQLFDLGELPSDEYHPRMRALHEENVAALKEIINEYGWPGLSLVGVEGAKSAWLIAQHAVSDRGFMSDCIELIKGAVATGEAEGWQLGFLQDRLLTMSGKEQIYGTQFDLDEEGWPVPFPIADPDTVDERRRGLGLNSLAERLEEMRQRERERRERTVVVAETARMQIREFQACDAPVLSKILADPSVMEFSSKGPLTEVDTARFIEWCRRSYQDHGYGQWALIDKSSNLLIGFCGLSHANVDGVDEVEIAYRLAKNQWGKGLATEAVHQVLSDGFARFNIESIVGIASPRHEASIRVLEKVGFKSFSETRYCGWDVRVYRLRP